MNALLPQLNAASLAGIVNGNGAWVANLVSGITPATVNTMISNLQPWLTGTLLPNLNTANIAAIANDPNTIAFLNALLPQLNATSMASIVNTNVAWLNSVVTNVTPATVNSMISGLTPWITGTLLPGLNTANIATIVNDPATRNFINALLPQLNQANLASIVNTNAGWMASVATNISPAAVNSLIAGTATWLKDTIIPGMTPATITTIAGIANDPDTIAFLNALLPQLNATSMAGIVNTNWNWMGDVVSGITPATVNSLLTDIGPWLLGSLMPNLDEHIIANLVNHPNTVAFINRLLPHLDAPTMASIVNTNVGWLNSVVTNVTPATVNSMISGLTPWITGTLLPGLNTANIATIVNDPATRNFINALLPQLNQANLASIVNTNAGWMASVATNISPAAVNSLIAGTATWLKNTIIPGMTPATITTIAGIANDPDTIAFLNALLPQLNATSMAGIVNTNWNWMGDVVSGITPATVNSLLTDIGPWLLGSLMPNLDEHIIANLVNHPNTVAFINRLLPHLDAPTMASIVNTNVGWLNSVVTNVTPATVNSMISGLTPWITGTLLPNLNTANIAAIANDPNTIAFINALLPQLNQANLASIVNTNAGWMASVATNISPAAVNSLIAGTATWLKDTIIPGMTPATITTIAGIANDPDTIAFLNALLPQLNATSMAGIVNTNWNWMGDVVSGITPATVNSLLTDIGPWLLGSLMPNLDEHIIANLVNHPNTVAFINRLLPHLDAPTMASIVNTNVGWLNSVVTNVTPATVNSMISGLTPWITGTLLPGLNTANIATIVNDPATRNFINALLPQLNQANLASIVNTNAGWMASVATNISPAAVNSLIAGTATWLKDTIIPGMTPATITTIAGIANDPDTIAFLNALLPQLNATSMAGIVNTNWNWLNSVVTNVTPATVNSMISGLTPWITGTLLDPITGLEPALVAAIANSDNTVTFLDTLVGMLNPTKIAGILNSNGAWVGQLVSALNTGTVVNIVNNLNPTWTSNLFIALNNPTTLNVLGNIANSSQFTAFVDALIGKLDPVIIAGVVNGRGTWIGQLVSNLSTSMVVDTVNALNSTWMTNLFTALNNPTTLNNLALSLNTNAFSNFVDALIGVLDPVRIAGVVNGRGTWIGTLVSNLSTSMVVDTVNALNSTWMTNLFTALNNPTTLNNLALSLNTNAFSNFVDALIGVLDPVRIAGVVNGRGAWIGQLVSNLNTGTVVNIVNNLNATWMANLFTALNNPTTITNLGNALNTNAFSNLVNALIGVLDPVRIAGVLNTNGTWIGTLVSNLSTSMVVDIVNNLNPTWTSNLFTALNNATTLNVLGNIANSSQFTAFVNALILKLDPAIMAGVLNTNGAWVGQLVSNLNTGTVVNIVNNLNATWMANLFTALNNPTTITNLGNALNTNAFSNLVNALIGVLDPVRIAGVLNTNGTWVGQLISALNTGTVVNIVNNLDLTWFGNLMDDLRVNALGHIASMVNAPQTISFVNALLPQLQALVNGINPTAIATVVNTNSALGVGNTLLERLVAGLNNNTAAAAARGVNSNGAFVTNLITNLNAATGTAAATGINGNAALLQALIDGINPTVVATAVNTNSALGVGNTLLERLVAGLNNNTANATARGINSNQPFLQTLIGALDTTVLANAINNNGPFITALIGKLDPVKLANAINSNQTLLINLLAAPPNGLDPAMLAGVINSTNGAAFLSSLLGALNPTVLAAAINAHPAFLTGLLAPGTGLNMATLATAINANPAFITTLITNLNAGVAAAASVGINGNQAFVTSMVTNLAPGVVATAINANQTFLQNLITGLDSQVLANVLNTNAVRDWLSVLVSRLTASQIAVVINNNGTFLTNLISNLNGATIAAAINANGAFLTSLITNLNGATLGAAISTAACQPFLTSLIGNLNATTIAGAINSNSAFVGNLLAALNTDTLATVLSGTQGTNFIKSLLAELSAAGGHSARGQALVDALNTLATSDSASNPAKFFDAFILKLHSNLNILGLGHHIEGKVEGFGWDANGGDW